MTDSPTNPVTGRHIDEIEITPQMIEAGYDAVFRHDIDIYDLTPKPRMELMLAAIYRAMRKASENDRGTSGV